MDDREPDVIDRLADECAREINRACVALYLEHAGMFAVTEIVARHMRLAAQEIDADRAFRRDGGEA